MSSEVLFVVFEHRLPTCLPHDHPSADLLRIWQEFAESHDGHGELMCAARGGSASRIAVGSFVETLDKITSLLEFNRKEESGRDVDALDIDAGLVRAA